MLVTAFTPFTNKANCNKKDLNVHTYNAQRTLRTGSRAVNQEKWSIRDNFIVNGMKTKSNFGTLKKFLSSLIFLNIQAVIKLPIGYMV